MQAPKTLRHAEDALCNLLKQLNLNESTNFRRSSSAFELSVSDNGII